jgi:Hemerythrin HHE cation binding domain
MPGPVQAFLGQDHARLDELLQRSITDAGTVDAQSFERFRAGLLRHIAMEEKVLLPAARRLRGGAALPIAQRLRADHAALAALMVPSPTVEIIETVRRILEEHNPLEEAPDGLYAQCEGLAGGEAEEWVARLHAVPEVKVAPHFDGPRVHEHIATLMKARGGKRAT